MKGGHLSIYLYTLHYINLHQKGQQQTISTIKHTDLLYEALCLEECTHTQHALVYGIYDYFMNLT